MRFRRDGPLLPPRGDQPRTLIPAVLGIVVLYGIGVYWWLGKPDRTPPPPDAKEGMEEVMEEEGKRQGGVEGLEVEESANPEGIGALEVYEEAMEEIAQIERENRPFWSRILRERFEREVTLEVDWDAFIYGSYEEGWVLYPLNIQRAGVERLLYAITGLMDRNDHFKTAARDRIESLYVGYTPDIAGVKLRYRKGRLTYRCFAGDWDGYYSIEKIQWELQGRIVGKSWIRKLVEGWIERLSDDQTPEAELPPGSEEPAEALAPPGPDEAVLPQGIREEPVGVQAPVESVLPVSSPDEPEAPSVQEEPLLSEPSQDEAVVPFTRDEPEYVPEEYDAALRTRLESVYDQFLGTITEKDLDGLLDIVRISRTDEETLRREMSSDGFVSFSEFLLSTYPRLDQTTFVSLRSEADGLAGYYVWWDPPYSDDYLNLTLLTFQETEGGWKLVFRISGTPTAILQVEQGENILAEAQGVIGTDPLMELKPPETVDISDPAIVVPELSEEMSLLKADFEAIYRTVYRALEDRDIKAFLSAVVLSGEDEKKLRKNSRPLFRAILENTPEPSEAIFVTLRTRGEDQAGLYFAAPYPKNPSFYFVYLRPFAYRRGRWRMVFSLEYDLAMNMSIAVSGGDLPSRAMEVINRIDLLDLEWVMSSLFEHIIQRSPTGSEEAR